MRVEGKRAHAKPRRRWEDNIETDQEVGYWGTERISQVQV